MSDKQILADLYDVLSSQQRLLSLFFKNHQALVETLINEPSLKHFDDRFQRNYRQRDKHPPKDAVLEALSVMQRKLDAIGATLKRDMGGLSN